MKLFKRKYKRSQWMEGLLNCEQLVHDGFTKDYSNILDVGRSGKSILHLWFNADNASYSIGIDGFKLDYCRGHLDYLDYYENNLKDA